MNTKRTKIVVVDDNEFVRDLICLTFAQEPDIDIFEAASGEEGWHLFLTHRPDIVLSDVMMPGEIDGLRLCQQIKASAHPCKVILISAKGQQSDKDKGLQAGADSYQIKPISPFELLELVKNFCA